MTQADKDVTARQDYLRQLTEAWKARAEAQQWKRGSHTYQKHALEFYLGAIAGARIVTGQNPINEMVAVMVGVGRDPITTFLERNYHDPQ